MSDLPDDKTESFYIRLGRDGVEIGTKGRYAIPWGIGLSLVVMGMVMWWWYRG